MSEKEIREHALELVGGPLDGKIFYKKRFMGESFKIRHLPLKIKNEQKYSWGVKNKNYIPKAIGLDSISALGRYKRETRVKVDKNCRVTKRFYKYCEV